MRAWLVLLAGLLIWTAHFIAVYTSSSLFPGTNLAKWLTGALTLAALGLLAFIMLPIFRRTRTAGGNGLSRWLDSLTLLGAALAGVAILYQGLPALTA